MDRTTQPRLPQWVLADPAALFAAFGVSDMIGVEGAKERIVRLSPRSEIVCLLHDLELRPDACRSCWFLAGEAR
ncbi:MAG TPA: hypothetical protein VGU26_01765 [Gaiellaceae bacterium]|nr:hypothetical protein [Gaiellaceae bacterium]